MLRWPEGRSYNFYRAWKIGAKRGGTIYGLRQSQIYDTSVAIGGGQSRAPEKLLAREC